MDISSIQLIRYLLNGGEAPTEVNFAAVYKDFKAHGLLVLLGTKNAITLPAIPEKPKAYLAQTVTENVACYYMLKDAEQKLTALLAEHGMTAVIFKGTAAGRYYPEAEHRPFGDIDFFVRGESDFSRIADVLLGDGFELERDEGIDSIYNERHITFTRGIMKYELHKRFAVDNHPLGLLVDKRIAEAEIHEEDGVYYFDSLTNGLIFAEHIRQHMLEGIGLRQIIDFMCYADAELCVDYYESTFAPRLREAGMEDFVLHIIKMCEMYFGLQSRPYAAKADEEVCRELFEYIASLGNFGVSRDEFLGKLVSFKNSKNIFSRLHEGGMHRWQAAQKHKILRPFAWLYQIGYIIKYSAGSRADKKAAKTSVNVGKLMKKINYFGKTKKG